MDVKWNITYKCRLCNETFSNGGTDGDNNAFNVLMTIISGTQYHSGNPVSRLFCHDCSDGSIGCADFIGVVRNKEDNQS